MDSALLTALLAGAAPIALDVAAVRWGPDSRRASDPAGDWW